MTTVDDLAAAEVGAGHDLPPVVGVIALGSARELRMELQSLAGRFAGKDVVVVLHVPTHAEFDALLADVSGSVLVIRADESEDDAAARIIESVGRRPLGIVRSGPVTAVIAPEVFRRVRPEELFGHLDHRERSLRPDQLDPTRRCFVLSDVEIPVATQLAIGPAVRSLDNFTDDEVRDSIFFVYFTCDTDALASLRRIHDLGGRFVPHLDFRKTDYRFVDRRAHDAMRATWARADRVSHLTPIVHENICEALAMVEDLDGDYVEIGVFLGGSALTALHWLDRATLAGHRPRHVHLLDTFDGFDYDEAAGSSDMIWADTHHLFGVEQTVAHLRETFAHISTPYDLVVSNICRDALPASVERIAVANIDVDMYEPTLAALQRVAPLVVPGGVIIAEDPASTPGLYGAYTALREFLDAEAGAEFRPVFKHGQYFLVKRW